MSPQREMAMKKNMSFRAEKTKKKFQVYQVNDKTRGMGEKKGTKIGANRRENRICLVGI
jgi:hypothetical protein